MGEFVNMLSDGHFALRWDDHERNATSSLQNLWKKKAFLDVTIVCDDDLLEAHKLVLSSSSPFFEKLLMRSPTYRTDALIYLRGTKIKDLQILLDFIYSGETKVAQEDLANFMDLASSLKINGLTGNLSEKQDLSILVDNSAFKNQVLPTTSYLEFTEIKSN